ncbi:hypothetical protein MSPP1_000896 [Malassezia sp. CBS 17886]|nr:hypothetical protein MSPP1_000896 [Malassezia sp. CBS 17886]
MGRCRPRRAAGDAPPRDPHLVTWDDLPVTDNPRAWTRLYRYMSVVVVSCYTLLMPMTSSMNAPALDALSRQFNVTNGMVTKMMMSSQMLALVFAPVIYAPMSETYGRKHILQGSNLVFLVFNMACGLSKTSTQMIVLRFFAGLAGCAPMSLGAGVVADLFHPDERGMAMALYTLSPLVGSCVGPIFAGWIIQAYAPEKWPWIFWVSTMFGAAVAILGTCTLQETYAPVLLKRKASRLRRATGNADLHTVFDDPDTYLRRTLHTLTRPLFLLLTEPVVLVPCIYQALMYGLLYLLLAEFPHVYEMFYAEPVGVGSLHYIAFLLGSLVTCQIGGRFVDTTYRRLAARHGEGQPEFKLPLLMVTAVLMPLGLLLYGWAVQYHLPWIVPDAGIVLVAAGIDGALFVCPLYLADSVSIYTASAVSAMVMLRGAAVFAFPLFSDALYDRLGQGWGNSVLALAAALVGIPTPLLLYWYGPALRAQSPFSAHARKLMS